MRRIKLSQISKTISSGLTPLRSNNLFWSGGNVPWLKTEQLGEKYIYDTSEKITNYALEKTSIKLNPVNSLSIAMYGEGKTRGNVSILKQPMTTNQACCNLTIDPKEADYEYVYYFLKTRYEKIRSLASGVRKNLNSSDIKNFEIILPDALSEQKRISSILSSIDSKIQLNNKINIELVDTAKLIYDYWFMQYDFPDENGKPYKSSGGKMVWNNELKKEVPKYWHVECLSDLISDAKNGDWGIANANANSIEVFCIRGADVNGLNGIVNFEPPVRYINKSHIDRLLKEDDLIIEISGGSPTQSTGRMAHISKEVLTRLNNSAVCSNFCKAISLKQTKLSYIISRYWDKLYDMDIFFNYEGKTSGIKNLLFRQLTKDIKIAIPNDAKLINQYHEFERKLDIQKQINLEQNKELMELRDWLSPMLMNGQVKIVADNA